MGQHCSKFAMVQYALEGRGDTYNSMPGASADGVSIGKRRPDFKNLWHV